MSQGENQRRAHGSIEELRQAIAEARARADAIDGNQAEAQRTADLLESLFRPPPIEAAFHGSGDPRTQMEQRRQAYAQQMRRQLREASDRAVETARQAPEPQPEPPAPFPIDWYNADYWTTENGRYRIIEMEDQHLWETIIWCFRSVEPLYLSYSPLKADSTALASRRWLASQSAFRSMLQEGLRRQLTFPKDVHVFVREYVLGKQDELTDYRPWKDPGVQELQADMQAFLTQPVVIDDGYGKERRSIDID